jgi:hypothetical protein
VAELVHRVRLFADIGDEGRAKGGGGHVV